MNSSQSMLSALVLLCFAGAAVVDAGLCARVKCGTKNPCRISKCDASSGVAKCVVKDRKNGLGCSDNNKCTFNDKCKAGKCVGTPKTCKETKNTCTTSLCNPLNGKCVLVAQRNGKSCDDGKACTTNDKCRAGRCIGTPKTCSAATGCQSSKCVEPSGECVVTMKADGATCFDDNKCTVNSTCMSGVCSAGVPKLCTGSQCVSKTCNPATGFCDPTFLSGNTCDDGKKCTTGDVCTNGKCKGTPITCPASGKQCSMLTCAEKTGACTKMVKSPNGTPCDDGRTGTFNDRCSFGVCKSTKCDQPANKCIYTVYNEATGTCESKLRAKKFVCNKRGGKCNGNGRCV